MYGVISGFELENEDAVRGFQSDVPNDFKIENPSFFSGSQSRPMGTQKQFKEDEDDFFETQYLRKDKREEGRNNEIEEPESIS